MSNQLAKAKKAKRIKATAWRKAAAVLEEEVEEVLMTCVLKPDSIAVFTHIKDHVIPSLRRRADIIERR